MDAVMKELNEYPGNIWTHIISLKREDAARLGYDHAAQWRSLLRAHRNEIAEAMHIPPGDFRWYAAFHDEGDHPHVHMMAWSVKPGQAYLSKDGIKKIKSALTNDIFKQEMLHTYEQKSASRDDLVREARRVMRKLAQQMRSGICDGPEIETLMISLSAQLETVTGKKKYGYLPKQVKATVNEIVDQMEALPAVDQCYQVWWKLQCRIEDFYSEKKRRRPPVSEQKEFRAIKNAVIQEAENIRLGVVTFEGEAAEEMDEVTVTELPYDCQDLWLVIQDDTAPMEERDDAVGQLQAMAKSGETHAQYLMGKLYCYGPVLIPDSVEAQYWFGQAAQELPAAQYALGAILLSDDLEVHDTELGVKWLEYAAHNGSGRAAYRLGKEYLKGAETVAKRRKPGSGGVHLRKDGRWEGRVVIGYDEKGLPKTKNVLAKTKGECVEKLKKLRESITPPTSCKLKSDMPFREWLDFWYENHCKPKVRLTTQQRYEELMSQHIIPGLGNIPLNELTQPVLQQFYAKLKESGRKKNVARYGPGLSDRTIRNCHALCRTALERAVEEKLIRKNPAVGCKLPPSRPKEMQVLTAEEIQRMLIQAREEGFFELFLLELSTGLRRGEICALQWDDLNFTTGELRIQRQVHRVKGKLLTSQPKTKASSRIVILPSPVLNVLKEYKKTIASRWMFPSPVSEDSPRDPAAVRKRLSLILEHAECKHVRFHDLQHP